MWNQKRIGLSPFNIENLMKELKDELVQIH